MFARINKYSELVIRTNKCNIWDVLSRWYTIRTLIKYDVNGSFDAVNVIFDRRKRAIGEVNIN